MTDDVTFTQRLRTGNEYVSIPEISASRGGIGTVGFLHRGFRACVELHGAEDCPLLGPVIEAEGDESASPQITSELVHYWIPRFSLSFDSVRAAATVFAPLERRGFVCVLEVENTSAREVRLKAGWRGCWKFTYHTANLRKLMSGVKHANLSSWMEGVPVVEYRGHIPLFAMALVSENVMRARIWGGEEQAQAVEWVGETVSAKPGIPVYYEITGEFTLQPSEKRTLPIYVGIGLEEVSAVASARDLRLHGHERLLAHLANWLTRRTMDCDDAHLKHVLNLNSFYNYFFAQGITLDTEDMVLTSARSSRSESCAAYHDHEAMLWSLPAVLQINWAQARKMLIYAYTTQLANVGLHSRFLDGVALEPGLQLDQLCAPIRALRYYVQTTGDMSILFDRRVQTGVNLIQQTLAAQRHPEVALFETLLLPSGAPSRYPYVCYSNVLVWRILQDVGWLYERIRDLDRSEEANQLCGQVKDAIWQHFVVDGPYGRMFASSIDLQGNHELGDDPRGSLKLLPHYEFCPPGDAIYKNTLAWIESEHNPDLAAIRQSLLSTINDLFTDRRQSALEFLKSAPLDDVVACETIDPTTGDAASGTALASCAGFLAYGLRTALGAIPPEDAVVRPKRRPSETLYQPPPETSTDVRKARL